MDEKMLLDVINRVFGNDAGRFEQALARLRLQAEKVQIISKMTIVQQEADKLSAQYSETLRELNQAVIAKQAEIDALEE